MRNDSRIREKRLREEKVIDLKSVRAIVHATVSAGEFGDRSVTSENKRR